MIRDMHPCDFNQVAAIHKHSFPDDLFSKLGHRCLVAQYQWFYQHFPSLSLVYDREGTVAGFVVGAMRGYRQILLQETKIVLIREIIFRPWVVLSSVKQIVEKSMEYFWQHLSRESKREGRSSCPSTEITLAVLAVAPTHRRLGIASILLEAFEEKSRLQTEIFQINLSVREDNTAARAVYEKKDWILHSVENGSATYKKRI